MGKTILISTGILAQRRGLDLGDVVVFGILGAVVGDRSATGTLVKGAVISRCGGGRYLLITPERLRGAENFFDRHGGKAIFVARFVADLRVFGTLVAGISHMRWRIFFYNALEGATWDHTVSTSPSLYGVTTTLLGDRRGW